MKKYLFALILFILSLFIFIPSYSAEQDTSPDRYIQRTISVSGDGDRYLNYFFFTDDGYHQGKVKLPTDAPNYVIYYDNNNIYMLVPYMTPAPLLERNKYNWFRFSIQSSKVSKLYTYNFDDDAWGNPEYVGGTIGTSIFPNDILYTYNLSLSYHDNENSSVNVPYAQLQNDQKLFVPDLEYKHLDGFRLHLRDFYTTSDNTVEPAISNDLSHVYINVYDFNSDTTKLDTVDLLDTLSVQEEIFASGVDHYLDFGLKNILSFMQERDGDYLISLMPVLDSIIVSNNITGSTANYWHLKTMYNYPMFVRFKYNATTKIGSLVITDSEGNPINGGGSSSEDNSDKEQIDAINKQTDAINNQTTKIEEQTEAIKEQHETSKNIFQKLLDLPRSNYYRIFRYA